MAQPADRHAVSQAWIPSWSVLKEVERQAHALYERLRSLAAADPLFVETAERL